LNAPDAGRGVGTETTCEAVVDVTAGGVLGDFSGCSVPREAGLSSWSELLGRPGSRVRFATPFALVEEVEGRRRQVLQGDGVVGSFDDRHLEDQSVTSGMDVCELPWFMYDKAWEYTVLRSKMAALYTAAAK
jgi:hypothetical protein